MAQKKKTSKKVHKEEGLVCPVCQLVGCLREMSDRKSDFCKHMNNSWIEFLEGVKCLIDERIDTAKKSGKQKKSRLSRIKVQD